MGEISTLHPAPMSIGLIHGEMKIKLRHLLIESYFDTSTNPPINDIKANKREFILAKAGGFTSA